MPLDDKSNKRVEKLFSDLEEISKQPHSASEDHPVLTGSIPPVTAGTVPIPPAPKNELETLRSRIRELEAKLNSAPVILYEKEEVGFAYRDEHMLPLRMANIPGEQLEKSLKTPLTASGEMIGEMQVGPLPERDWTAEETNMAGAIARQASLQIQNLRLLAATEHARAEAQAATRRFTHENWESFLDGIHHNERIGFVYDQSAVDEFNTAVPGEHDHHETVNVLDEQVGNLFLKADPRRPLTDEDKAMVSAVAKQLSQQVENLRLLADASRARADAEEANRRLTRENWQSYTSQNPDTLGFAYDTVQVTPFENSNLPRNISFAQPLTVRGETIGQLTVAGLKDVPPGALELATNIAEQVSVHIENLRLFELNEKRAHELETVAVVSTTASTVLNPDELLQSVVDLTKERFNLYHSHIYLTDDAQQSLLLAAGAGETGRRMVDAGHAIPMDEERSLVAHAARERNAIIANDVRNQADFLANPFLPETRSEMALPMISGGRVIGVFDVQSGLTGHFTEDDANIYSTLASQVAVALQNARLYVEQSATVTQLRELDRLKSSFLANMSHELRTPLNSILGFSDVMLEELDGPLTENMANDLGLIQKNGKHLLHLINDVLDMAKIESGKMNLMLETFRVHEIIEEVTSITSTLASEKNLALYMEGDSDQEVEITADRTRLRQIMINVVNNAIKFTEQGRISIRVTPQTDQILIAVRDTGLGIPPDKLEAVFQEFTQVDTSSTRKAGGTGLGLPISRKLVEMHGGRLWAESSGISGEGSTFFIELPCKAKLSEPEEKMSK